MGFCHSPVLQHDSYLQPYYSADLQLYQLAYKFPSHSRGFTIPIGLHCIGAVVLLQFAISYPPVLFQSCDRFWFGP